MVKVKLAFFSWDTFYGKLIRFGTKCKWTHVGIIVFLDNERVVIYEALNKGLVKNEYSAEVVDSWIKNGFMEIKEINVPRRKKDTVAACESYLGKPYDWLSIFNIGYYILFGKYALKLSGSRFLICSEFVARVLYDISGGDVDFEDEIDKPYDYITPADLYNSRRLL